MSPRDLADGVPVSEVEQGKIVSGQLGDDEIVLVRDGANVYAVGAHCTHYHGPLAEGLVVDGTIRCPWHHACFDLHTGAVLRAPALADIPAWDVEQRDGRFFIGHRRVRECDTPRGPSSVVIVGAGAAGVNVATTLRAEGFGGTITLISRDSDLPFDKPNLSKDFLAGNASVDWLPLYPQEHYADQRIDLRLGTTVASIDTAAKTVTTSSGESIPYGALVIATGARVRTLTSSDDRVKYLRTRQDSEQVVASIATAKRAAVIGSSFIGLEVAASLKQRGLEVTVISRDEVPLQRVLGRALGAHIRGIHEKNGVVFRLGEANLDPSTIDADLIVAGIGVTPEVGLAKAAGLEVGDGVVVNEFLETSVRGVFACGDIASLPSREGRIRVEHWVVAGRQGQTVARNILGRSERFGSVPFFWSAHFDVVIAYVGHGSGSDETEIRGSLESNDASVIYRRNGQVTAIATIGRDMDSLRAEWRMERGET